MLEKQILVMPFHLEQSNMFTLPEHGIKEAETMRNHFGMAVALSELTQAVKKGSIKIPFMIPYFEPHSLNQQKMQYLDGEIKKGLRPTYPLFEDITFTDWEFARDQDEPERARLKKLTDEINGILYHKNVRLVVVMMPAPSARKLCWTLNDRYTPKWGRAGATIGWSECFSVAVDGSLPIIHWRFESWYADVAKVLEDPLIDTNPAMSKSVRELAERLFKVRSYDLDLPRKMEKSVMHAFARNHLKE